jgi:TatD DNase family protein
VDCHAHVCAAAFDSDRRSVLEEATGAGVAAIVAVAESTTDAQLVLQLAKSYPGLIAACLGLHPVNPRSGTSVDEGELPEILSLIEEHCDTLVAVGEVGLDFTPAVISKDAETAAEAKASQRRVFTAQVQLACRLGLPLNVHSRGAGHHAITLMSNAGCTHALLHAFDGKVKYAVAAAARGFFFSVPASVSRDSQTQKLVQALPLSALVLESDSPALPAEKGARNTPAAILTSLQAIAELKGLTVQETAVAVTANSHRLFPRLRPLLQMGKQI